MGKIPSPFDAASTDSSSPVPTISDGHAATTTNSSSDSNAIFTRLSLVPPPPRFSKHKRKKEEKPTALMRAWVRIDAHGESSIVHADKMSLSTQLGIQARDLRLLESTLANQTSVILCRERAILINMAFVKAIITTAAVYIVSPDDPASIAFLNELKQRLHAPLAASKSAGRLAGGAPPTALPLGELSFELKVLEICLDELTCDVDERATQLEDMAYPTVEAMAERVQPSLLERVRRIKTRLSALLKVAETFREVLEALLDDDKDMWEMNLSAKEAARAAAEEAAHAALDGLRSMALEAVHEEEVMDHGDEPPSLLQAMSPARSLEPGAMMGGSPPGPASREWTPLSRLSRRSMTSWRSGTSATSSHSSIMNEEIAEVEMLLEAYFMHIDNVYNRLKTLGEYIEDTEDLVNIKLDAQRNRLISCDLAMAGVNTINTCLMGLAGYFAMNLTHMGTSLPNPEDDPPEGAPRVFTELMVISSFGTYLVLGAFLSYMLYRGVMQFAR
uniref:Magnesium transporter n=1 Tax=Chlamydomonas leiostraca TaxID=1034604 RepID=A0A7S0NAT3_9CHLO|mmetsp:Transcript_10962/g.26956  ORF Transcript_10962/g.26956 Transcript_10962/m.26956 type:complete len:503 (+) Transcript_10962:32-1540(+)